MTEKLSLNWNNFMTNVVQSFHYLRHEEEEETTDVTLVGCTFCDKSYRHSNILRTHLRKEHKIILRASLVNITK